MTTFRPLRYSDFQALWKLGQAHIDTRIRPDMDRAAQTYRQIIADRTNCALGEFEGDKLIGGVVVAQHKHSYAGKAFGSVYLWIGSVALLDQAVEWWEGRPVMRSLGLQFPQAVPDGVYRLLRMRGFTREGDMNMLWRK